MISRNRVALAVCVALLSLMTPSALLADNLIVNGGFETGDFTGWTIVNNSGYLGVGALGGPDHANSGSRYANFGALSSSDLDIIEQTVSTTPGQSYFVNFWVANDGPAPGQSDFQALWNGVLLTDVSGASAFGYTDYIFTVSGTGSDTLTFEGYNEPGFFDLDDVSVDITPEPSSLLLLGTGLLGICWPMRRRLMA